MSHHCVSESSEGLLLDQCEAIVEEGLKTLEKVERALEIIEQMQLYKKGFNNLESYHRERWLKQLDLTHLCKIKKSKSKNKE